MKKVLLLGIAGLVCFSGAAALSWFALPKPAEDEPEEVVAESSGPPQVAAINKGSDELVGVRNSQPASPEQLFRTAALLEKQHKGLVRQREILEQQEGRLKLLQKDMENHKRELDGTYALLRERIGVGENIIEQLRSERQQLEMLKKQNENQAKATKTDGASGNAMAAEMVKKIPLWLGGMDPEQAAKVLREMSDDSMDTAVQLLTKIDDRTVSKILAALNEPKLVAQLMERIETARTDHAPSRR